MSHAQIVFEHFPDLTEIQKEQIAALQPLYESWNAQINVISRKDMDQFYVRHVLHSLAIPKVIAFKPGTRILDVGTGGGFPGIPLAIMFPEVQFHLVDSIGKKVKVVRDVADQLGLENVEATKARVEELEEGYHFVVNRAVASMPKLLNWVGKKILKENFNELPNGIISLKGGDLEEELGSVKGQVKTYQIADFFSDPFFETKKVVYISGA